MLYVLLSLVCVLLGIYCILDCRKPPNFPPGPPWLPLIGCLPTFGKLRSKHGYLYLAIQKLSNKYGTIMGLKLGNQKIVVVSTHDLIKEVLLQDEFNGRPDGFFFRVRAFGKRNRGILFADGSNWSNCRKFTAKHLRTFGFGRSFMTSQLNLEAEHLVEYLRGLSEHGPVAMHTAFDVAVLNSLWSLFAGRRFQYTDRRIQEIMPLVHTVFRLMDTVGGIVSQMSFLRFVIPELSGYNDLMRILHKFWGFLDEEISNREKSMSEGQPKDLIEAYLQEIASTATEEKNDTIFDRENLMILCLDLFLAGSKTTTDTLAMTFSFLARNPHWVKILQEELDAVVGRSRAPALEDYPSLPMMEAFLTEIQRFLILAPLGVPHRTMKDVTFKGYRIPKDTVILLDFHSAHNDKAHWENPEEFRPQRFLDDKGHFRQSNVNLVFGLGKRRCLGEILARSTLFLFFANVIHHFDLEPSPRHELPEPDSYDGFTISPKPYHLILVPRTTVQTSA